MEPEEAKEMKNRIEAILFSAGRAVTLDEICRICKLQPHLVKEAVNALKTDMDHHGSPLLLIEETNAWKLTVRERYLELVRDITPHTELDKATLETLAVIAWKQPVMQAEVVKIRTSAAYEHISWLVEKGFIAKEKKGRSYVLKTTGRFFDYFDLPGKEALKDMLKSIEGSLEAGAQKEGVTEKKLGSLDVYAVPEGEQSQVAAADGQEAERLGKLEVYDGPETEGEEAAVEEEEASPEQAGQEETEETPAPEDDEERAKQVIHDLAEDEEEKPDEEAAEEEKPRKKLHPALEKFIEDEEDGSAKEKKKGEGSDDDA